jgi:hypothetical protein
MILDYRHGQPRVRENRLLVAKSVEQRRKIDRSPFKIARVLRHLPPLGCLR